LPRSTFFFADFEQGLVELDRVMKGLLDVQALMTGHSKVLSDIIQSVARGDDIVGPCFSLATFSHRTCRPTPLINTCGLPMK
jgi:hypothetical protein